MKYKTGSYILRYFDKYGTRQGKDEHAPNMIQAIEKGKENQGGGSFTVLRVVHNSVDRR